MKKSKHGVRLLIDLFDCEHYTTLYLDEDVVDLYFTNDEVEKLHELLNDELVHEEKIIDAVSILVLKKPSKTKEFYQSKLIELEKLLT